MITSVLIIYERYKIIFKLLNKLSKKYYSVFDVPMGNCSGRSASSERVKTDPTVNGCMSERYDIETARQLKKKIRTDYRLHKYYSVIAKSEQTSIFIILLEPHGKIVLGRNLITGSIRKIYKFENHDPESGLVLENLHNLDIV